MFVQNAEQITVSAVSSGRFPHRQELLVDPIKFEWFKTLGIIENVLKFILILKSRRSPNYQSPKIQDHEIETVLFRYKSAVIKDTLKPEFLKRFKEQDNILYYQGKITEDNPFQTQDLENIPFLDIHEFTGKVPVLLVETSILLVTSWQSTTKSFPMQGLK